MRPQPCQRAPSCALIGRQAIPAHLAFLRRFLCGAWRRTPRRQASEANYHFEVRRSTNRCVSGPPLPLPCKRCGPLHPHLEPERATRAPRQSLFLGPDMIPWTFAIAWQVYGRQTLLSFILLQWLSGRVRQCVWLVAGCARFHFTPRATMRPACVRGGRRRYLHTSVPHMRVRSGRRCYEQGRVGRHRV